MLGTSTLITGGAGFIGSHLCLRLLQAGFPVTAVDCFTDYYPRAAKEANLTVSGQLEAEAYALAMGRVYTELGLFEESGSLLRETVDLAESDPAIDRLELVKGPGSVMYGSDAIGGTANALTRSPFEAIPEGESGHRHRQGSQQQIPRHLRVRIEDTVLIGDGGYESLVTLPRELTVVQ